MESTQDKWQVSLTLESNHDQKLQLTCDGSLTPGQKMTSFMYACDHFKEELELGEI